MRIDGLRFIRGTNAYARQPLVVARLQLDRPPPPVDPAIWRRLADALGEAGAFLPDGPQAGGDAVALAQAAIDALLRAADVPDSSSIERRGQALARIAAVIAPLGSAATSRRAIVGGVGLARAAIAGDDAQLIPSPIVDLVGVLRAGWETFDLDVEHREVATTCERLGIPWKRPSYMPGMMQFGEGSAQVKMIGMMTDATTNLGARLSRDKAATNLRLMQHGYPVPRAQIVDSRADARAAMRRFGFPMVVKPRGGKWNRGVTIVYGEDQIDEAFDTAAANESGVVAESFVPGREYRMLVARGTLCGAHERVAPTVVGDGATTVAALIERANRDPAQLAPEGAWGAPIVVTELTVPYLRHQGLTLESVPRAGMVVGTSPLPFRKYGAHYRDASLAVHPANERMAIEVAQLCELDLAGIDIRMADIARPWDEGPAGICEVNAGPGLDNIAVAGRAAGVDVSARLLERIVPPAARRPMPFALIVDVDDPHGVATAISARIAAGLGWRVGVALPGRVRLADREIGLPENQGPFAAIEILVEAPGVDAGLVVYPSGDLIDFGFARDRYDIAAIGSRGGADARASVLRALLAEARTPMLSTAPLDSLPDRIVAALLRVRGA
ncbi:MAG: ATP-grasp domain-containing protein [Alphaproteobacteria bacterium]